MGLRAAPAAQTKATTTWAGSCTISSPFRTSCLVQKWKNQQRNGSGLLQQGAGAVCSAPTPAAWDPPVLKGSRGFMECGSVPKGSRLITGPSAVADSSAFVVMTEESNLQPVAGKLGATQGWLGRRAAFIDGLGSRRLCGRNLVNGPLGPLPPDSAISPYLPATAQRVSRLFIFFSSLSE